MRGRDSSHASVDRTPCVAGALRACRAAVEDVAGGDAATIVEDGIAARTGKAAPAALVPASVYVMPGPRPGEAVVRWPVVRGTAADTRAADLLAAVARLCSAGEGYPEVQSSPPARAALVALQEATTGAEAALARKLSSVAARGAVGHELRGRIARVGAALREYDAALAAADAIAIDAADLPPGEDGPAAQPIAPRIVGVRGKPGKHAGDAVVSWQAVRGAAGYAIRVSFSADDPEEPFAVLRTSGRRPCQIVSAPVQGIQFFVRVAAVGSDGRCAGWSEPVLVTAR